MQYLPVWIASDKGVSELWNLLLFSLFLFPSFFFFLSLFFFGGGGDAFLFVFVYFFVFFLFFALFCLLVCLVFFGVIFHAMVFTGLVSTHLLLVLSTAGGLDFISKTFSLCKPIEDKYALSDMLDWLAGIYSNLAMVDYPYAASFLEPLPAWPVKVPVIRYCQPCPSRYLSFVTASLARQGTCHSLLPAWPVKVPVIRYCQSGPSRYLSFVTASLARQGTCHSLLPAWPVKVPVIRYCQPGPSRYLSFVTESVGAVKQCYASFCLLPIFYYLPWFCEGFDHMRVLRMKSSVVQWSVSLPVTRETKVLFPARCDLFLASSQSTKLQLDCTEDYTPLKVG